MESALLLRMALDIGEALLRNGAEVYRVEDSIERFLKAYGAERVDVFTIPSLILATMKMKDQEPISQNRRILHTQTDFEKMSQLNDLCRCACAKKMPLEKVRERYEQILKIQTYPWFIIMLSYAAASFSFSIFFGGDFMDGAAAGLSGAILYFVVRFMKKLQSNTVFIHLMGAGVAAGCALLFSRWGLGSHLDKIVIGNIMMLIPGIELTNGMRDLFSGDIMAGVMHLVEAIFIGALIAFGAAFILSLGGV